LFFSPGENHIGHPHFIFSSKKGGTVMMSGISGMSGMTGGMRPDPQQVFNRMDKDGSAGIDKDELSAMTEKMADLSGTEIDVVSLMEEFDGDADGILNQDETHAAMESLKEQMGPPPNGGPGAGGGPPPQPQEETSSVYGKDGVESGSTIDQLLDALSDSEDEDEEEGVVQAWIQALKGENQSYSPVDIRV
jgi:hypothetical protein